MAAPTLEHNPSFKFQHSSPLDTLVRRTSNRSANAQKSRNMHAAASPSGQNRYPPSPSYTPHVTPPHRQDQHATQPPSPLLHTQFRGSTFTTATYDHHNSFLDTSMSTLGRHDSQEVEYRYRDDDDASVYSTPSMLPLPRNSGNILPDYSTGRPDSWDEADTATAAPAFIHVDPPPGTGRPGNGDSTLRPGQGDVLPVPTVVISPAAEPASPALTPMRGGKTPIAAPPPKFNFSRPGRPPVLPPEDHKQEVIERNARRNRTQAMPPPSIPIPPSPGDVNAFHQGPPPQLSSRQPVIPSSINAAPPSLVPQRPQAPPPLQDQLNSSQPDGTLHNSRGAEPPRSLIYNSHPETSFSNPSTSSLPYQSDQVDHRSLYKSASKPDMSINHGAPQSLQPDPYIRTSPLHQQQFPRQLQSFQPEGSVGTESVYSDTLSAGTSSYVDSSTPQSSNFAGSPWLPKDSPGGNVYSALSALDPNPSIRSPGPISLNDPQDYRSYLTMVSPPTSRPSSVKSGKSGKSPRNKLRKPRKPSSGYESDGYVSEGGKGKGKKGKDRREKSEKIESDAIPVAMPQFPESPKIGVELPYDTLSEDLLQPNGHHLSTMTSASGLSAREDLHPPPAPLLTNPHGGWLSRSVHPPPSPSSSSLPASQQGYSIPSPYRDDQPMATSPNTDRYGMPLSNGGDPTAQSSAQRPWPSTPLSMSDTQASLTRDHSPDRGRLDELGPDSQIPSPTSPMSGASSPRSNYPPSNYTNGRSSTPEEPPRSSTSTVTPGPPKMSIELPREPPPRAVSPAGSVYSQYSFYQLDSMSPSPTGSTTRFSPHSSGFSPHSPGFLGPSDTSRPSRLSPTYTPPTRGHQAGTRSPSPASTLSPTNTLASRTAQDYLQLGIQHHEANRLKDSAVCFEKSAKEGGGCGVGMVMWGLSLRHGWGCEKDEANGFKWLQKAAEGAVTDLESSRKGGLDASGVQVRLSAFPFTASSLTSLVGRTDHSNL